MHARVIVLIAFLLPLGLATADHYPGYPVGCQYWAWTDDYAGLAYVAWDNPGGGHVPWIYVETNGEPGLQRGGHGLPLVADDPCVTTPTPDTLIF